MGQIQEGFQVADAVLALGKVADEVIARVLGERLELVEDGGCGQRGHPSILIITLHLNG